MKPKTLLITTALTIATTAAFGAASVRTPQLGGATVTPAATTNTARAGTMRAQTMKTSPVSSPASVTTTQSIATPVSTETTDARIALLKGIKGFSPNKVKDTTAAQQELNAIDSRIEELQSKLDQAEAAQSSVISERTIDQKIEAKLTEADILTRSELDRILETALPPYQSELQDVYQKTIDGHLYFCGMWQITIPQWEEVLSRFIRPKCRNYNLTYGNDCILDGDPKDLRQDQTIWKWRFKLCRLDNTTPPPTPEFQTLLVNQYYTVINNEDNQCYRWRISLSDLNEIIEKFIKVDICNASDLTYGENCNLIPDSVTPITESIWKTQFDVCLPYTSPIQIHYNTIGVENPLKAVEGYTILTNASDTQINNTFLPAFCGTAPNYWCNKFDIEGDYDYSNPQDRRLRIQRRLRGLYMIRQNYSQIGDRMWVCETYTTNEPSETATTAQVAEYVNAQVCQGQDPDKCFVVHVYDFPTTTWAKPRFQIETCASLEPSSITPEPLIY